MTRPGLPTGTPFPLSRVLRPAPGWVAVALVVGSNSVWAQRSGLTITPTFSARQEITDNRNLSATDPKADAITTITPGLRISSWTGPLRGSLDFGLRAILYARDPSDNSLGLDNQNALSAAFTFEVVDQHFFVDASASITQQSVSAFGLQSDRPSSTNSNTTEYRTLTVSPYFRGKLFDGAVDVEGRLRSTYSDSADDSAGASASHAASVSLSGGRGVIGWSVVGSRSYSDYDGGRATASDRLYARVSYAVDPTLRFFVSGGYERNDVLSEEPFAYKTWGGGVAWQPTPRTQVSLQSERRYFGNSWSGSISHRMRRAVVTYTDSRSESNVTTGAGVSLTTYDLFFAQFASIEPDPALRDVLVRNFLQAVGLDPNERLTAGFISRAATVTRSQNLSLAVRGRRITVVLSAFATSSRRVDALSTVEDDLSRVSGIKQQGVSLSLSHRLTPTSSVSLRATARRTPGRDGVVGNELRELSLGWSDRIGARSSVSLTGRHTQATGANPYRENAMVATYNYYF